MKSKGGNISGGISWRGVIMWRKASMAGGSGCHQRQLGRRYPRGIENGNISSINNGVTAARRAMA